MCVSVFKYFCHLISFFILCSFFPFSRSFSGFLELLNEMNDKLEAIQKSLDMYLETKRQFFARFYFLSNDDLLEILGQSKNPEAVG